MASNNPFCSRPTRHATSGQHSQQQQQQQQQQLQNRQWQEETEACRNNIRLQIPMSCYMMRPLLSENVPDGSTRYNILKYSDEALKAMNQFRQDGALCDVTLLVKGEQLHAHKIVLAACSLYFRGMFTRGMKEASSEFVEMHEPINDMEILRTLVDFAYTHEILVNQHNVQRLLTCAFFLQMNHVVEACSKYMEEQLDPSNCVGIAQFASLHGCIELEAKSKKYIQEHFSKVVHHDEFLTLSTEDMVNILTEDELNIRCETEVFQAVVRWVEHDTDTRLCELEDLLEKVRLSSLAPYFLEEQLQNCSLIQRLPSCVKQLVEKLRHLTQHRPCADRPHKPCQPCVIYSVGGFCRKAMNSLKCFECYNPESKAWTRLPDLPNPACGSGVTSLHGHIYVIGGRIMRCGECVDSCSTFVYDPTSNVWASKSHLSTARNRVGVAVLDNRIYAVGGSVGGEQLRSAERFDPYTDTWEPIASMRSVRLSAGVAVTNRFLYAIGGFDGTRRLSSVERYHPELDEWQEVEPMCQARSGAGVAVLNGCVYAVGGFDGERQLMSVEKYDPQQNVWTSMTPLSKARSGVGVAVISDKLYALGGYDGTDFLSCMERYDPCRNVWETVNCMLSERSGHGVVVEREPAVS